MFVINAIVRKRIAVALIIVAAGLPVGCGGRSLSTVEGTVTFDGEPVEEGTIVFEPVDGVGASAGGEIKGGKYRLADKNGVPPGKKLVRIIAIRKTGEQVETDPGGPLVDDVEMYIPAVYNQASTLEVEVPAGEVTHDFELTSQQ